MSIIEHVTLQKIVAHDFRYDPRIKTSHSCYRNSVMLLLTDSTIIFSHLFPLFSRSSVLYNSCAETASSSKSKIQKCVCCETVKLYDKVSRQDRINNNSTPTFDIIWTVYRDKFA